MTDAARFSIGPLTMAIDAGELQAWVDRERPGKRLRYAVGPVPLRAHPTFILATALRAAGCIQIFQPRSAQGSGFDFIAEKLTPLVTAGEVLAERHALDPIDAKVFAAIRNRAACGLTAETDREIAARCGLPGADAASYRQRKLKRLGLIAIEHDGNPLHRKVITIVATGQRTVPGLVGGDRA